MAISVASDFKIYQAEFNSGLYEKLAENSNIFNAASRNGIVFLTEVHRGEYIKNAYFKQVADLVSRQDITSTSAATALKLEQVEEAAVKCHRKIGPVDYTLKAFEMAGIKSSEGSYRLGKFVGDAVAKAMADLAIIVANAAVTGQTALVKDITGDSTKTANLRSLVKTRGLWGDQMGKLACWLMHSTPHLDLIDDGLANYHLESIAGIMALTGDVKNQAGGTILVSDNSNLYNSGTPTTYNVIGIAPYGVVLRQSELQNMVAQVKTGYEQIIIELQGEYALTISVDGFAYNYGVGGANPTDATIGTTTNWTKIRTDTHGLPLVKMKCQ